MSDVQYLDYEGLSRYHELIDGKKADKTEIADVVRTDETTLTDGNILLGNGSKKAKDSAKSLTTTAPSSSSTDSTVPTSKAVYETIKTLDGTISGSAGAGKTLTAFSQTDGKVSATFGNISITKSQVSDFPTIPTVNNATFSVKTKVGTNNAVTAADFTANQSTADDVTFIQGDNVTLTTDATNRTIKIDATDTTYESKSAASGGTDVSLVTTGEKHTWNSKQNALTNPVTRSGSTALTADKVVLGAGTTQVKPSSYGITTTAPSSTSDDTTIPTSKAVWSAVSNGIAANDAMVYKGTIAGGSTGSYGALTSAASKGETYKVTTAGKINGIAVEVGDMLICNTDSTAAATSSNYSTIAANWDFIQANIDGAVTGPASSTANHIAVFDGTTGKVIKDGTYTIGKSVPSNAVFTDASVTSVANHYTPSADENETLAGTLSGTAGSYAKDTLYTVLTGVSAQRDAKGHVTGITYTAQQIKDTNNTYTVNNGKFSVKGAGTEVASTTANASAASSVDIVAGSNVTVTPDATNHNITIAATDTNTTYKFTIGTTTKGDSTNGVDLGTLKSETAAASGTTLSLVTTGEKATWNGKQGQVAKLGSTTKPVYTSAAGTFAECSTYAGGTAVTLNGASKAASTASFYAPTSAGTSGQVLISAGSGAPGWGSISIPTITYGSGDTLDSTKQIDSLFITA